MNLLPADCFFLVFMGRALVAYFRIVISNDVQATYSKSKIRFSVGFKVK